MNGAGRSGGDASTLEHGKTDQFVLHVRIRGQRGDQIGRGITLDAIHRDFRRQDDGLRR